MKDMFILIYDNINFNTHSLNIPTQLTSNLEWHEETGLAKKI